VSSGVQRLDGEAMMSARICDNVDGIDPWRLGQHGVESGEYLRPESEAFFRFGRDVLRRRFMEITNGNQVQSLEPMPLTLD
jgi:hypothetical protein